MTAVVKESEILMKLLTRLSKREYGILPRLLILIPAGVLFLGLIPFILIKTMPRLDAALHLPSFHFGIINFVVAGILIVIGIFFGWWSIGMQLFEAKGTPLPLMATQKLLISGPFIYCRNPMTFGTICAYSGVAIAVGSLSSLLFVIVLGGLLIIYLKRIEEIELAERFGQEYFDYKAATPFIIPNLWIRRKK
jgi:protein-S-isoprenylcysteine O-methyltransferase Ste14